MKKKMNLDYVVGIELNLKVTNQKDTQEGIVRFSYREEN